MKFLSQFSNTKTRSKYIYNAESPSVDPAEAARLALAAESSAERNEISAELIEEAMGIARAVDGINVDATTGEFVLADPFTGSSEGITVRLPIGLIANAGLARQVVDRYVFLSNNGNIDIDGADIYYMADVDNDDETVIDSERLEAILFDDNTPQNFSEYQDFVANPVALGNVAPAVAPEPEVEIGPAVVAVSPGGLPMVQAEAPVMLPADDPFHPNEVALAPGMDTGTPLDANAADLLPPAPERAEVTAEQLIDPSFTISEAEIQYLARPEIAERLILFPEENANIAVQLRQALINEFGGTLTADDYEQLTDEVIMLSEGSRRPTPSAAEIQSRLEAAIIGTTAPEAVESGTLNESQIAQITTILGADAESFLASRPANETPTETMALVRALSVLKGAAAEVDAQLDDIQNQIDNIGNTVITDDQYAMGMSLNGLLMGLEAQQVNLMGTQETFLEGYQDLLSGEALATDRSIRNLLDAARAVDSGLTISAQAHDDGIEAQEATPEVLAQLQQAKIFIDAFAQFRPGSDLPTRAYQLINNNDLANTTAVVEEMLDGSVRHWWHNMWGNETYQTARTDQGLEEAPSLTAEAIMTDPSALAQALREIEAFEAAEGVMLQTTQAELTAEGAELSEGETAIANDLHAQLFDESGNFDFSSSAATSAETEINNLIEHLRTVDPLAVEAVEAQKDELIMSRATSTVFTNVINSYLENNGSEDLSHLMSVYEDMTGISNDWRDLSDETLNSARDVALFIGGSLIPVGAIVGFMARAGKAVNFVARGTAAVVRTPVDEVARVAAGGANFIDDAARIGAGSLDDVAERVVLRLDDLDDITRGTLNELKNLQGRTSLRAQEAFTARRSSIARTLNVGDDAIDDLLRQLDEVPGFASVAPVVADDLGSLALRSADDIAVHADDALPVIRPSVVDDVVIRPPQALARPVLGLGDDALRLADNVTPQSLSFEVGGRTFTRGERVLYQTADGQTIERYIVGQSADGGVMLRHTPLDDALMSADTAVDDLYRASQMSVVRPDALARITRFDDIPVPQVASALYVPQGFVPRIVGGTDTLPPLTVVRPPAVPAARNLPPLRVDGEADRLPSVIPAAVARPSFAAMVVPPAVLGSVAAAEISLADPVIVPSAADTTIPDQIRPDLISPNLEAPFTLPDVTVEAPAPEPTLAEQIEAIGSHEIRAKANEIRAILAEHQNYTPGDWQNISNEIAQLFELELTTEEERISFGNRIQGQVRDILGIDTTVENLNDGKIGRETMSRLDTALISVNQTEITNRTDALQTFEAQATGGWRANNRAMAELFGINFAEDATDAQLITFGRSIQAFAGGTDGQIGPRTIARLKERLAALDTA